MRRETDANIHDVRTASAGRRRRGVEQLTIRRIAETIHRTQPAVYPHFAGKDAILAAVVVEGLNALVERLERDSKDGLTAIARSYVLCGFERPKLYDVMFATRPAIAFAATPSSARAAFRIVATAVAASGLDPARIGTVTEVVWASLHGLIVLTITDRLRPGPALHEARLAHLIGAVVATTAPS